MNQNKLLALFGIVLLLALILMSSLYVVNEREKAVVVRFGEVLRVDETSGLRHKLPFFDEVHAFSTQLLSMNVDGQPLRTADEKDVVLDLFIEWRITDARQYYVSSGGQESAARKLLLQMVTRRLSEEFSKRTLKNVTGGEWRTITDPIAKAAAGEARPLGIEVADVRLQRIGVQAIQTVFERMRSERGRIAGERRTQGVEAADKIRAEAERDRDMLLAESYARSERIRGEGEARAASIYANAAAVAPEFFSFYRSMNAYKESFKKKGDVMVVDPSSDFFRYMKKPTR